MRGRTLPSYCSLVIIIQKLRCFHLSHFNVDFSLFHLLNQSPLPAHSAASLRLKFTQNVKLCFFFGIFTGNCTFAERRTQKPFAKWASKTQLHLPNWCFKHRRSVAQKMSPHFKQSPHFAIFQSNSKQFVTFRSISEHFETHRSISRLFRALPSISQHFKHFVIITISGRNLARKNEPTKKPTKFQLKRKNKKDKQTQINKNGRIIIKRRNEMGPMTTTTSLRQPIPKNWLVAVTLNYFVDCFGLRFFSLSLSTHDGLPFHLFLYGRTPNLLHPFLVRPG